MSTSEGALPPKRGLTLRNDPAMRPFLLGPVTLIPHPTSGTTHMRYH